MKCYLIIFLSLLFLSTFSQVDTSSSKEKLKTQLGFLFSLGLDKDFINPTALDSWTSVHYNTTIKPKVFGAAVDIGMVTPKLDCGFEITANEPFQVIGFYEGGSIIRTNYLRTFINLHVGVFTAGNFNTFAPLNYTLTPSQVGQKMVLQYGSWCFALSLKNIITTKTRAKEVFLLNSLDIKFSYMLPFKGDWQYGYFPTNARNLSSTAVTGIPSFSSYYFSVIYCFGIMGVSNTFPKRQ